MNICAATKERVYNHNEIYEVKKNINEKLANDFIRVGYATVVEENSPKEEKPKRTVRKKKNEN